MKVALICCPFFTNGNYPPLGLACINGALRAGGHQTLCFDFAWFTRQKAPEVFHLTREFFAVARTKNEVVFALGPELGLYLLYGDDYRDFRWRLSFEPEFKSAAVALGLLLWHLLPKWASEILSYEPELIMFSSYSSNIFVSLALAKHLRKLNPDLPIIFGGPGASLPGLQEFLLNTGLVNGLVVREGELTAQELCTDLSRNLAEGIPGLATMKNGQMIFRPRELAPDLDSLPRPDFEGFPFPGQDFSAYGTKKIDRRLVPEGFPVSATRGCVNRCAYCSESVYWKKFRERRVEAVIADLERIYQRYDESAFSFNDSALNCRPEWLDKFCEQASELGFERWFWCYLIPDETITEQFAVKMYKAGFRSVTLGVETFSDTIRRRIHKGVSGEEIFQGILALTRAGIDVTVNLLVGFPGETESEFESSLRYIERLSRQREIEEIPGKLFFEAGHRVRLEAYSHFFQKPSAYGLKIYPYQIPLPESCSHLEKTLSRILLRWSQDLDEQTIEARSARMRAMARECGKAEKNREVRARN